MRFLHVFSFFFVSLPTETTKRYDYGRKEIQKGVPVKPTDDVDVDKEYQLIPIDSL